MEKPKNKLYLGDSVYAESDGFQVLLFTQNGHSIQNMIVLEPETLKMFLEFIENTYNLEIKMVKKHAEV